MTFIDIALTVWNNQYLRALGIFILAYILMQIVLLIFEKVFLRFAKNTKTKIDDLIVDKTRKPLALLIVLIGAYFASASLGFSESINFVVSRCFSSLIILFIVHLIVVVFNILIDNWAKKLIRSTNSSMNDDILTMIHRFIRIVLYLLGIMYVLSAWGVEIGPMLASLGIAGLAVALAIKPTLSNIFGGITLIADKVLRVGDTVELDDGSMGKVQKISLRSTKIKTFNNELMTIPNGKLADSKLTNWHMPDMRVRITINFGVEYGSDPDKVKKLITETLKKDKIILKDPEYYVLFTEMAESSLNFMARFWIESLGDKLATKDRILTAIYKTLNKNKIGIPFPTRTIYLEK